MIKVFKNRVIITYLVINLTFLITSILFISNYFKKKNFDFYIKSLKYETNAIYSALSARNYDQQLLSNIALKVFNENGIRLTFIDNNGNVLADSEVPIGKISQIENHKNRPEVLKAIEDGEGFSVRFSTTVKKELIYFASLKEINGKKLIIRASVPLMDFRNDIKDIRKSMVLILTSTYFIIILIGFVVLKKIFNPVDKIMFASKQYAAKNFSYRINIDFTGEMKKLAETLNEMSKSIESNIKDLEYKNTILSNILGGMEESIVIVSNKEKILTYNKRFEIFFGVNDDVKNKFIGEVVSDSEFLKIVFDFEKFVFKRTDIKLLSGRFVSVFAFPVKYENEENKAFVIYDIDKEKRLEIIKRDFIANFSHEIKTPLSVIKANIETIISSNMSREEIDVFLKAIEKNVSRIENILRDIIKLSYIESYAKPNISHVDLKELLDEIIRFFEITILKKNISVDIELRQTEIKADKELLEDAIFNLMDNAVKYNNENGFIRILSYKNENSFIVIENSGPTIPQEYLERIFERFFTVDKSRSKELGGTGLGLSIVKHIMDLHQGFVKAESLNNVNRFILMFPS